MSSYNQKEVIFLVESPLTERNYRRYGIQNWINHGWKVNVFDVTSFNAPEFWKEVNGEKISSNFKGLTIFKSIDEILFSINNLQNEVVFIDLLDFKSNNTRIRKIARVHGVILKLRLGSIPRGQSKKKILELFRAFINPVIFANKLILFVKNKVIQIRTKKFDPDYIVVGGTNSMSNINNKKTSIIKAHNFDYDYFIDFKSVKKNINRKYLLFLDEDAAYHSDYKRLDIQPFVTANNYYPTIDYGLNKIAESLKLEIKIAAHPRSNYETKLVKFKLPTIKNNTFELIKDADVIVGHSSTAFQLAILLKKPIILVTTNEIQEKDYAKHWEQLIQSLASALGKKIINFNHISNLNNFENYLNIDHEKYEKYINKYIKTKESPEKKLWDIVIERIENDLYLKKKYQNNDR